MYNIEYYISKLDWKIWNGWNSDIDRISELHEYPYESAILLKGYLEMLQKASRKKVSKAYVMIIQSIIDLVTPKDFPINEAEQKTVENMQENCKDWNNYDIKNMIDNCTAIIQLSSSLADKQLKDLNKKWCEKFLYFNGDEDGSCIICPEKIYYDAEGEQLLFDGVYIGLESENSRHGEGVLINTVESYPFKHLYYIDYIYDENDNKVIIPTDEDGNYTLSPVEILDLQLSSRPIDTVLTNRIRTWEQVQQDINEWINLYLDRELEWTTRIKERKEKERQDYINSQRAKFEALPVYEHMKEIKSFCPLSIMNKFYNRKQFFNYIKEFTKTTLLTDKDFLYKEGFACYRGDKVALYKTCDEDCMWFINILKYDFDSYQNNIQYKNNTAVILDNDGTKYLMNWYSIAK